ncbi:stage II sporulation protein R [Paenibacillus larvae]
MVKRKSYRIYMYLIFAVLVMMMCWDANRTNAAVLGAPIPQDSIRLRILANSDKAADQAIKRRVRDEIVAAMQTWVKGPHSIEEARGIVKDHLPELRELTGRILKEQGYDFGYTVKLGVVPFPTKMYGNRVYPAGDYEALRVTLGEGKGQNWWCVLFPPLCFVDSVKGEAVATAADGQSGPVQGQASGDIGKRADDQTAAKESGTASDEKTEVRFFLVEVIKSIIEWIASIFK